MRRAFWALADRLGSLRFRAMIVLLGVVIAPLLFVWLSKPYELTISYRMNLIMEQARADVLEPGSPPLASRVQAVARRHGLRLRLLQQDGHVLADHDYTVDNDWSDSFGALGFTQEQIQRLKAYDDGLPPIMARAELIEARQGNAARGCTYSQHNQLLVCVMATRLEAHEVAVLGHDSPLLLHMQAASPRAIRSLYDVRYQLLKLAGQVFLVALGLGLWLGWRMVSPLRALRRQVVERAGPPVSTRHVEVRGRDEVTDVARAFNDLLSAFEAQRQANLAFMADVAHEIKNPVAAIQACAQRMAKGEPMDAARVERVARILGSSSERLDVLVSRFLELARVEAGQLDEERVPIALDELVARLVQAMLADERYAGRVQLQCDLKPALVLGSPQALETAARNVLDNAVSFSLEGAAQVRVRLDVSRALASLVIEDDGPGISPQDLPRIFDRFFTRRADDRGTGLGLAMTRAIVHAHGGQIHVSSTLGQGTRFVIELKTAALGARQEPCS